MTSWGEGHRKLSTDLRQGNAGDLISFGDLIYRFVLISECPIAFMMAKGSAPAMAICDPKVWRRRIIFRESYFDHSLSQRQSRQPSSFCKVESAVRCSVVSKITRAGIFHWFVARPSR